MNLKDKTVLVVGLARTGVAVARFLVSQGARVIVTDMKDETALAQCMQELAGLDIDYQLGRHDRHTFLMADLIVVSPGVPMDIAPLQRARAQGREIISEIELASAFISAPMVAITGTNGKTTTTTLTGEIFRHCGFPTFVGGNIDPPLIELLTSAEAVERVVVELSSFQLEAIKSFHPRVSVLLNITEDHLDRYETFRDYIDAKMHIFDNQSEEDFAVLNIDDPLVKAEQGKIRATVVPMSRLQVLEQGIWHRDGVITFRWQGREETFPTAGFKLQGVHNIDNIMAALASTLLMGCPADRALAAVNAFKGLPHRMEHVATVNGIPYYDDSKGTNVGSVVKSLESFPGKVTLIAGGKDKGGEYAPLADLVRERVSHLILLGEAKERIRKELGNLTDTHLVGSLEEAVKLAHRLTEPGGVVLLSPACSSFDMFSSYKERGDRFKAIACALAEK
ncbi:UDP-N-acetylmuramoyl-L-alanine--D-glutamate ligase [Geobacter sp. DSM 9736]|uniref:UDP-N-acetylmuramoyl-L-alanine--D-glutamate ligase n=1 Tax=Geobacter sp. DSM 9736 TaxID=1277350 RepID=UPI000B51304B|nr:UDP-N-acetylmuramoyl-L-alanine--D-glutamate ligase [Geobacter sp. DSM 9736]